ncbi:hypothetical protein CATYP_03645 [Corynebacterium atypicum]|uniref:DUF4307 domain-containing protein n=1 Tax=Corynebacterium atypicum TaxID=191610 RepID=A0ABN4DCG7_9CORY|nr:hypothetical protein CATYP_03645 [Corynebacterium atypicum]
MARPVERYGATRRPLDPTTNRWTGRAIIIAILVVAVLTVVFFAQFVMQRQDTDVSATMSNFQRVDDNHLAMRVDVSRDDPSKPAYCIVTAIDYDKAEVGRRDVILPAGGDKVQRLEVEIPTRDVPVSGSIYGCSSQLPSFLRAG